MWRRRRRGREGGDRGRGEEEEQEEKRKGWRRKRRKRGRGREEGERRGGGRGGEKETEEEQRSNKNDDATIKTAVPETADDGSSDSDRSTLSDGVTPPPPTHPPSRPLKSLIRSGQRPCPCRPDRKEHSTTAAGQCMLHVYGWQTLSCFESCTAVTAKQCMLVELCKHRSAAPVKLMLNTHY